MLSENVIFKSRFKASLEYITPKETAEPFYNFSIFIVLNLRVK